MALVGEVGAFPAFTVPVDATAVTAAERMRHDEVGDVMVVDAAGKLVGIVTDRDLAVRVVAAGRDPTSTPVKDVMTADPLSVDADVEVADAERIMRDRLVHRLPVLDGEGKPIGLLSLEDLAASGYVADGELRAVMKSIGRAYQLRSLAVP